MPAPFPHTLAFSKFNSFTSSPMHGYAFRAGQSMHIKPQGAHTCCHLPTKGMHAQADGEACMHTPVERHASTRQWRGMHAHAGGEACKHVQTSGCRLHASRMRLTAGSCYPATAVRSSPAPRSPRSASAPLRATRKAARAPHCSRSSRRSSSARLRSWPRCDTPTWSTLWA
eukprot:137856-Chlamydomonas_euryale.AAC.1